MGKDRVSDVLFHHNALHTWKQLRNPTARIGDLEKYVFLGGQSLGCATAPPRGVYGATIPSVLYFFCVCQRILQGSLIKPFPLCWLCSW